MMFDKLGNSRPTRVLWLLAGAWLALGLAVPELAAEPRYVLPDGRKVQLIESDTELGVLFRRGADIAVAKQRLANSGRGRVHDIKGAETSRVKILDVSDARVARQGMARQDASVETVHRVFRFPGSHSPVIATGTIAVKLPASLSAEERAKLWSDYGIVSIQEVKGLHDVYLVSPLATDDEIAIAEEMAGDARTLWSQPNLRSVLEHRQVSPQDQFFSQQWHLNNTGQLGGSVDADIDAPEAWLIAEGQDILFGMFDDACDVDHPDLRDNYIGVGHDPSLDSNDPGFTDPRPKLILDRHGTSVMGLAAARANTIGTRGVSYLSRFTVSRGLMEFLTDEEVARVFTFARQQEVDVHINSWGPAGRRPNPQIIVDAIETASREGRDLDGPEGDDPPLGMVIIFAAGNNSAENEPGFELSTLPTVIGVGSSNDSDALSSFSNYGPDINFLAPGAGEFSAGIATTDNEDGAGRIDEGYNIDGLSEDHLGFFTVPDIDPTGSYTGSFGGTSASCPIAAGVAALALSANRELSATNVRLLLEHTCDKVNASVAGYDGISDRSLKYGYGRINARRAVDAARLSLTNGGRTWPDVPSNLSVSGTTINWDAEAGTDDYLVVESNTAFSFIPVDGTCYDQAQLGCGSATPAALPSGVTVLSTGCLEGCEVDSAQSATFEIQTGAKKFFAIYARSSIGRYSFGTAIDSEGTGGGSDPGSIVPTSVPAVTIAATPLEGESPLTIRFNGNAVSEIAIDDSRTAWDFDTIDGVLVDATTAAASYTYIVEPGEMRTVTARLTMFDVADNPGFAEVSIRVRGADSDNGGSLGGVSEVQILVGVPGTTGSDNPEGTSPFEVEMRLESDSPANVQSVVWDLGDGGRTTGLIVPHTYINESDTTLVLPVSATVTILTSGGVTLTTTATRLITVHPGTQVIDPGEPNLPGTDPPGDGGTATICGTMGMLPLLFTVISLTYLRRRRD